MARLSQLFAPREREFFDLFEEAGSNIVRAAELLERMLDQWPDHVYGVEPAELDALQRYLDQESLTSQKAWDWEPLS